MSVLVPGAAMIAVTFGLARYGYGLLLPDMRAETGMTAATAGVISSAAYASYLAANIGVVQVVSRWGPRLAVGGAAALAAVGMLTIALAEGAVLLAVGVLVAGAAAGSFPPYADFVDRHVPPRRDLVFHHQLRDGVGCRAGRPDRDRGRRPLASRVGGLRRAGCRRGRTGNDQGSSARCDQLRRPQLSLSWFFCPRSRPLLVSAVLVGGGSSTWWAFSVDAMRTPATPLRPDRLRDL